MKVLVPAVFYLILAAGAVFVCGLLWGLIAYLREQRALSASWREYRDLQDRYGDEAKERCPHRVVEFGQTGVAGVVTMTTKWCKTCRKHLGSAELVESIWGNYWR
jgi:hypothetical protein